MADSKRLIYNIVTSGIYIAFSLIMVPATLLLGSCNTAGGKKMNVIKDSTSPFISMPLPAPISKADSIRFYNACARWYDSALKPGGFNGGMLVAKNGNIVFEAYNGNGHLKGHDVIDSLTPFHIASVSKTFTAMAVLKLWQDGKLNIDDEFSKYFPQFNYPGVTIRSLLSHRSGLPNYLYFMESLGWDKSKLVQNQDVLDYLVTRKASLTNISSPNTHFTYCNTNFALLALLVEKVTGEKFPDFLQQTFFTPLQMKHTFIFNTLDTSKVNPSYDWRGRLIPLNFLDGVYGDKNVYTTPRDLLTWDRALTSGLIFTPQTLQQAYAPYSNEKSGIKNYGLGWRMNIYPNGKKTIYHNGWWHGNNAAFIRLLQDSATIIVVDNKYNRNTYHAKDLANLFDDYGGIAPDEEEAENTRATDNMPPPKHTKAMLKKKASSKRHAAVKKRATVKAKRKRHK